MFNRNRVVIAYLCVRVWLAANWRQTMHRDQLPRLFKSISLSRRVSWNCGLMKLSPGPECVRTAKWIQKNHKYSTIGTKISPIDRATKCFQKNSYKGVRNRLRYVNVPRTIEWPFLISRISHRSINTARPMVTTVKIPLTLEAHVHAMNVPVASNQPHHSGENSL